MDRPREAARRFLLLAVIALALSACPSPAKAEEPEVIKGTVRGMEGGALVLYNVRFPDPTIPPRDVRILVDKETAWFDGPLQVTKEAMVPGLIVLVRCKLDGSQRRALLVRIIGGKKPG